MIDIRIKFRDELNITNILDFNFRGKNSFSKPYVYYTMPFIELGDLFKIVENWRTF